jgi:hypothetical protein
MSQNRRPPTDLGSDDGAIEATVGQLVKPLLAHPNLAAPRMPPGRREWFEDFATRSLENALLPDNRRQLEGREDFDRAWTSFSRDFADDGVVVTVANIMQLKHDPDGEEEHRGWAFHAREQARLFLQERDVRDILESAIETKDAAVWARYPGWFGSTTHVDSYRAKAVRFLRYYNHDVEWLIPLLDEDIPEVRYFAAMHLARDWPDRIDDKLLACLVEASEDDAWTWSWSDHFAFSRIGREEALDVLARFADRPIAMAALQRAEHARLQQKAAPAPLVRKSQNLTKGTDQ